MANLNVTVLSGRLTKDIELKKTTEGKDVCSFTVACSRRKKKGEQKAAADFIRCIAWNNDAKFLNTFCHKGSFLELVGHIQTRSYANRFNETVYVTEVVCDHISLHDSKKPDSPAAPDPLPPINEDDCPF